jgi:predicted transcriptional regulator|tara:strand:- start:4197 stop:4739 length:543 start_codon:yes stop_codon:yes gene_type:complete
MKDDILKLRKSGLTYDEIVKKLGCSKSTISYHCNNNGLGSTVKKIGDDEIKKINEFYLNHTALETANNFNLGVATITKYVNNKRIVLTEQERKAKNVNRVRKRRRVLKEKAIKYKGGNCEKCGYDKCNGALQFHHLDPKKKEFGISNHGVTRSWVKIKKELDKCIMVCANCHFEIHEMGG